MGDYAEVGFFGVILSDERTAMKRITAVPPSFLCIYQFADRKHSELVGIFS